MSLVVLRSPDIERAVRFYQAIGMLFTKHRHGSGPEHYATEENSFVFEIYPIGSRIPTTSVRIGFSVDDVDSVVKTLADIGGQIVSSPKNSPWGRRAVIKDLDGHTIELTNCPGGEEIVVAPAR